MRPRHMIVALVLAAALSAPAFAQVEDANALRASGAVGETATGYMAPVPGAVLSDDLKRAMDQINIKRRAAYTEKAGENGLTVAQFAQNSACAIFKNSVKAGQWYRDEAGAWHKSNGAITLPSWCGN